MVAPKGGNGRWLRKYKIFFFIGILILLFQIFLAANFLDLSKNNTHDDWQPQSDNILTKHSKIEHKSLSTTNATNLRVEELDFKPKCEINTKETISAIHRAKSQKCKQHIANVSCLATAEALYPKYLKGHCPVEGKTKGHALGCFKDENNFRLLTGYVGVNKKSNSPKYCIELCLQSGFEYAGVEYSNECFCGNEEPSVTHKLPDSSCNMKCPGDNHAACGGYYTINVYETGINKFVPQVANAELITTSDDDVRIVFLLTINGRALRQVKRLIKLLYHQRHYYYIHVDVREDYLFRELLYLETRFQNIRLSRRRFATIWGGASLLEMLLSCMNDLLNTPSWHWDFILNLSESDYPVKLPSALQRFLSANRDHNFVKSHGRDTQRFLQKQGLDKTFVECDMRMWRVADRKLPQGLQMDGGSDWIALSRKFVKYVAAEKPDELVTGLKQVFKYTLLPAESFFHTVLRNSRFCNTYIDNNLHVTNWKRKLGCKCQYKHVVDWCGCSPNDFRLDDWTRIQSTQSRQLFFARKFEPIINQAILLKLELWLFNLEKPSKKVTNLHSYWQSIYHYLDLSPPIDDGFKTLLNSIIRLWLKTTNCTKDSIKKIISSSSYHSRDLYEATLVYFVVGEGENIEIGFSPLEHTYLASPSSLAKRFDYITITTDFDQKEQISRNWARSLSPFSEPVLVYKLKSSEGSIVYNISCLWIDPTGILLDVSDISIDENGGIGSSKPSLKQPHLPGAWTVKIVQQQLLIAEIKFLIIPLEFHRGNPLTSKQAPLVNGGSTSRTVIENYDKFLGNNFDEKKLRATSVVNSYKTSEELQRWIDSLVEKFYKTAKVCAIMKKSQQRNFCGIVNECIETSWSSFAADPKSAIGKVNQTSGMFDIW